MPKKVSIRPYLSAFFSGNIPCLILFLLEITVSTASVLASSWLLQQITDFASGINIGFTFPQILFLTVIVIALEAASYLLLMFSRPLFIERASAQYQNLVFAKICEKGIAAFSRENSALYLSALSNDAASIESGLLLGIFRIANQAMHGIGALVLMYYYSPLLTFCSLALSLLPLAASIFTGSWAAKAEKKVSDANENFMSCLKDALVGFSVIKSFRAEGRIRSLLAEKIRACAKAKCIRRKLLYLVQMFAAASGSIVQFGVFLIGAYLTLSGSGLTAGTALIFVQLLNFILNPISVIPQAIAECRASCALIQKAADAVAANTESTGTLPLPAVKREICLRNLHFSYEESKPVLQGIDLTLEAGKSYALVGASGSGKSTLLSLLMASYPNYQGSITLDGQELRDIAQPDLYDRICTVQQQVFIFNASIRDNITLFSSFDKEDVDRAIDLSGLRSLIDEKGEDYLCGENGSALSGGEKQRISIARALLRRTDVLLADEATASLDKRTAHEVTEALLNLTGITRILVTHSLQASELQGFDCILTLRNGRIEESGSFDELMARKGYFYSLYTVSQ